LGGTLGKKNPEKGGTLPKKTHKCLCRISQHHAGARVVATTPANAQKAKKKTQAP